MFLVPTKLCSTEPSHSQWRAQGAGREQNYDSWLKLAKGIFHTTRHQTEGVLKGVGIHLSLLLLRGLAGHRLAVVSNCLCITCYIHTYIFVIIIILFSILVYSFISTHKFYSVFFVLFFQFSLLSHWGGWRVSEQLWCWATDWVKPQQRSMSLVESKEADKYE